MARTRGDRYRERMSWWKKKAEKPLLEQLNEARDNLSRSISVLGSPSSVQGLPPDNRALIVELREQLDEVDEAISDQEADNTGKV